MARFLRVLVLLSLLALPRTIAAQQGGSPAASLPNFVVLLTDDLGYGDLSSYGHPNIRTPNLDRMASEGIRLTGFYASWAVCTPSRAGLLTGRYAVRMGLTTAIGPGSPLGLPAEEVTLAEALRARGYRTAMIGKWHLGDTREFNPLNHGFDRYFGIPYSNDYMPPWVAGAPPVPLYRDFQIIERPVVQPPLTRRFTEEAAEFIRGSDGQPFFLYLAYTMPHLPLSTSEAFRGHSRGGLYGDVIEELDWSAGEILRVLREEGVDRNTVVVFTSDNGPWLNAGARMMQGGVNPWDVGSPGPFRGSKGTTYEAGSRVPAIIRWPAGIQPGRHSSATVSNLDFYPTFLEIAGIEPPPGPSLDGRSVRGLLERGEEGAGEREFFYFSGRVLQAVRQGAWKLRIADEQAPELFNLEIDPSERHNVAAEHPQRVEELRERMREFAADTGARVASE